MGRKAIPVEPYIEKLEQALAIGATYELACMFAGISVDTFHRWRAKAVHAAPDTPLGRLRDRLIQAEGRAAIGWLAKIEKAANEGDWHAAAWKMERRYPEWYGRKVQADLSVQIQKAAQEVADEVGIDVSLVLKEAYAYLEEGKRGNGH